MDRRGVLLALFGLASCAPIKAASLPEPVEQVAEALDLVDADGDIKLFGTIAGIGLKALEELAILDPPAGIAVNLAILAGEALCKAIIAASAKPSAPKATPDQLAELKTHITTINESAPQHVIVVARGSEAAKNAGA